ncbi:hypothetical protein OQA88_4016 [Cercophora sp. LCS_1]
MAPLATEPGQVLLVLNIAKRKALYSLIVETTQWMRSQIELKSEPVGFVGSGTNSSPSPELIRLRSAALAHFDAWRREILPRLKEVLSTPDDAKVVDERRKKTERMSQRSAEESAAGESLIDLGEPSPAASDLERATRERESEIFRLRASYHAIPTRLSTISIEDREETLSCILLLLLSAGKYAAESRALAVYLASALELPLSVLNREEAAVATFLVQKSAEASNQPGSPAMSADTEAQTRKQENQAGRFLKVGLASVAGAALIGVTGGLAAPVVAGAIGGIMGTVGLGGVASVLGIFFMNPILVGGLFGAYGARMTGGMVDQYAKEVEDFKFIPLSEQSDPAHKTRKEIERRLRVTIGVNGWLVDKNDIVKPWRFVGGDCEVFALRYEMKSLLGLGASLQGLVTSYAWNTVKVEILKRTVLATLWSALWPVHLLSVASSIDNPFSLAKNRSEKAGKILADALVNRVQGHLVSGKIYNVFSENDYLLAFLYRATSIQLGVAGLQEIKGIEGVENLNLSQEVSGHMRYPELIDKILARCGLPVAEGAATGPIEQEEEVIVFDDADPSQAERLIELDFLQSPGSSTITKPEPDITTDRPSIPSSPEQRTKRATVTRATSLNLQPSHDPLGNTNGPIAIHDAPPVYTCSVSAPTLVPKNHRPLPLGQQQPPGLTGPGSSTDKSLRNEEPNVKYSGTSREMALTPKPTWLSAGGLSAHETNRVALSDPYVPFRPFRHPISDRRDEFEDEDHEDNGPRIHMVDNDSDEGEFAHVDPVPIDDDR